jgi:hypothetical protein
MHLVARVLRLFVVRRCNTFPAIFQYLILGEISPATASGFWRKQRDSLKSVEMES